MSIWLVIFLLGFLFNGSIGELEPSGKCKHYEASCLCFGTLRNIYLTYEINGTVPAEQVCSKIPTCLRSLHEMSDKKESCNTNGTVYSASNCEHVPVLCRCAGVKISIFIKDSEEDMILTKVYMAFCLPGGLYRMCSELSCSYYECNGKQSTGASSGIDIVVFYNISSSEPHTADIEASTSDIPTSEADLSSSTAEFPEFTSTESVEEGNLLTAFTPIPCDKGEIRCLCDGKECSCDGNFTFSEGSEYKKIKGQICVMKKPQELLEQEVSEENENSTEDFVELPLNLTGSPDHVVRREKKHEQINKFCQLPNNETSNMRCWENQDELICFPECFFDETLLVDFELPRFRALKCKFSENEWIKTEVSCNIRKADDLCLLTDYLQCLEMIQVKMTCFTMCSRNKGSEVLPHFHRYDCKYKMFYLPEVDYCEM